MLVHDHRNPAHRPRDPAERRGAVTVKVQYVDLFPVDDLQQRRQRGRIELRFVKVRDVDAKRVQRFLGQISFPQADQGDVEAAGIEPWDHPRKQPLDAVHARPFPAQVIAHLQHVQFARHALRGHG